MPTPLAEVVEALQEESAFLRLYDDCLQFMAVRGHIEFPPADQVARRRRRIALLDEASEILLRAQAEGERQPALAVAE